jgi:hypothetical protein
VGGNLKDRDSFQKLGIGRSILHEEIDLEGIGQESWATLICLKIGARKWLCGHNMCEYIFGNLFGTY